MNQAWLQKWPDDSADDGNIWVILSTLIGSFEVQMGLRINLRSPNHVIERLVVVERDSKNQTQVIHLDETRTANGFISNLDELKKSSVSFRKQIRTCKSELQETLAELNSSPDALSKKMREWSKRKFKSQRASFVSGGLPGLGKRS
jgi:hypothetical protein